MANKLQKLMINRADLVDNPSNPLARVLLYKSKLTAAGRKAIPAGEFAYVAPDGTKHLPIHDAAHVRNALARFDQTDIPASAKAGAKRKILAAAKKFGINVAKDAATTNTVLAMDEFWDNYYDYLDAFRTSVGSIMCDETLDDKGKMGMLKESVTEVADQLSALFDTYPVAKTENDEIYDKFEKTVDVLTELDTLIDSGEISANEISDLLEDLEMAEKTKETQETVETLKAAVTAKDAEIAKAQADITSLKAEIETLKAQTVEKKAAEPVDIWKGVNPEIKAQFEALQKSADESAKIAKAAEENAAMVKLTKRVSEDLTGITGTVDEKASLLREVEKMLPADKFEKLYTTLKDASTAIAKSAMLEEKGHTGGTNDGNTAFAKLQAKAQELVDTKVVKTKEQGIALAAKQNPELYKEYMTEGQN